MDPKKRFNIKQGLKVNIVLKEDQRSGKLTQGIVKKYLDKFCSSSPWNKSSITRWKRWTC